MIVLYCWKNINYFCYFNDDFWFVINSDVIRQHILQNQINENSRIIDINFDVKNAVFCYDNYRRRNSDIDIVENCFNSEKYYINNDDSDYVQFAFSIALMLFRDFSIVDN